MRFFKTAILDGLFVLLPLVLLWIMLREIAQLLVQMATPIADMLPAGLFDNLLLPGVVALILLAATSLLIGIAAKSSVAAQLGHSFEGSVLNRVPMYRMLKLISSTLIDTTSTNVSPALLRNDDGTGDPCYVIEQHDNDLTTILLPWSPASFAGSIKVVPKSKLEFFACSLDEFSRSLSFMGVGLEECMTNRTTRVGRDDS